MKTQAELEKAIGEFLVSQVPPGSGPEARREVMAALASVTGMYLGGDLAKLGRRQYVASVLGTVQIMQGVAETTAIQLRGHAPRAERLAPPPIITPQQAGTPPSEMFDEDGEKGVLLSSMSALINVQELEWWKLPGWPTALARTTPDGIQIVVQADPAEGYAGATWKVTRDIDYEASGQGPVN